MDDWRTKRVLDYGFVHLRDSMPHWTSETSPDARIVEAARVSFAQHALSEHEARTPEQDRKLIHYLMRNKHTSPFEKVRFEFVIKLPIFVARQWIRHRTGSFNEVSARYTELPDEFYVPAPHRLQEQSASNKQGSGAPLPPEIATEVEVMLHNASTRAHEDYQYLLRRGLARELARIVLPLNVYTAWYWTVDLHNLFHFLALRLHPHAQYEIRAYAKVLLEMVERIAPVAVEAWMADRTG